MVQQSIALSRRPVTRNLFDVFDFFGLAADAFCANAAFHESVDITVEHGAGVRCGDAGAQILDHLIGLQHVRAYLMAPADVGFLDVAPAYCAAFFTPCRD